MKKVHFYLRESKSKRKTIYLCVRKGRNKSYRKSLNLQVLPSDWSKKTMRVKYNSTVKDKAIINNYLNELERNLIQFFNENSASKREITLADIKDFVLKYLNPNGKRKDDFMEYLKTYRNRLENRISCTTGKPLSQSTKDKFRILFRLLRNYQAKHDKKLDFDDINMDFYHSFIAFLQDLGYSCNTVGKYLSAVKTIMNEAVAEGYTTNLNYKNRQFKPPTEDVESVYLTHNELKRIQNVSLPQTLDNSRKLFLIGCYTGLRFSDLIRLSECHISQNRIRITQKKTGNPVVIPLHLYIKGIIEDLERIKTVSNAELNRNIKIICKLAGIKRTIVIQKTQNGTVNLQTLEKWQLVCTHTARRTFATNLYLDGVPPITIMKITGHKTESAFMRYIKISQEENARILEKYWRNLKI